MKQSIALENHWVVECVGPDGKVKWVEEFDNLVTNVGLDDNLDKYLKGSTYTASWYVGLTSATPTVDATDTVASHVGWTEFTNYTEGTRVALQLGTVSSQSVDNSGNKAAFSINTNSSSIGGAYLVGNHANANVKGNNTDGTLYGVGAFTGGNKSADSGDTLNVTVTCTAASA